MATSDIIQLSILFVLLATAYIGIFEIKANRRINEANLDWNRKNKTQDALNELVERLNFPFLRSLFGEYMDAPGTSIPLEVILEEIEKEKKVYTRIVILLNSLEALSRGVLIGLYDEELVKMARRSSLINWFYQYQEFIKYRREINNSLAWTKFEKLVRKWEKLS